MGFSPQQEVPPGAFASKSHTSSSVVWGKFSYQRPTLWKWLGVKIQTILSTFSHLGLIPFHYSRLYTRPEMLWQGKKLTVGDSKPVASSLFSHFPIFIVTLNTEHFFYFMLQNNYLIICRCQNRKIQE